MAMTADQLPDDPDVLKAMVLARDVENARLTQIIKELQRHRFGRRAESLPEDQLLLGLEEAEQVEAAGEEDAGRADLAKRRERTAKRRANRGALPAHLPRVEMIVDIEDHSCPCCRDGLHRIGEDVSERLDIVPAQLRVIVVRRPKYACRACEDVVVQPRKTLEVVAFCEEGSSRFPNANFWGSRAITGRIKHEDLETVRAFSGETIESAMREISLDPTRFADARRDDIDTFIELHIEQGPVLEQADVPVAIVDAITGIRHYHTTIRGTANHAGAFPMDIRKDAMAGFAEIASGAVDTAHRMGRPAVTTIGRAVISPNFPGIIPSKVEFTVDARHPDPTKRSKLYRIHEGLMQEVAFRRSLDIEWKVMIDHEPALSDPNLVHLLRLAAADQDVPVLTMASGAAHDAQQMASIAKMAMIFVRSKDGRSHTPEEFSSVADMVSGIKVLAAGLHTLAY